MKAQAGTTRAAKLETDLHAAATEELDPWRGPELDIPGVLRR